MSENWKHDKATDNTLAHTSTPCVRGGSMVEARRTVADLQGVPPLVHAARPCQDQAGVGVLHPLLHLTLEFATPS